MSQSDDIRHGERTANMQFENILKEEIKALRTEIERLRAALRKIADTRGNCGR